MTGGTTPAQVKLFVDDDRYRTVARQFLLGFVSQVALQLAESPGQAATTTPHDPTDLDKLFSASFNLAAQFERHNGFLVGDEVYYPHVLFSRSVQAPEELLASWRRTALHGQIDDEILIEASRHQS